jgi:hypothetical protein
MRLNMLQEKEISWKKNNVLSMFFGLKCNLPRKLQANKKWSWDSREEPRYGKIKNRLLTVLHKKRGFLPYCKKNRLLAIFTKKLPKVHFATIHPLTTVTARMKYLHTWIMMWRA